MKKDIHPSYYPQAKINCACGNKFTVGATVPKIETEICSKCHPFYTGQKKIIDAAGQVKKFEERIKKAAAIKTLSRSSKQKTSLKTKKETKKPKK